MGTIGLGINEDGWAQIRNGQGLTSSGRVAEFMGMDAAHVDRVLMGEVQPDGPFIASALTVFPVSFSGLFDVQQG